MIPKPRHWRLLTGACLSLSIGCAAFKSTQTDESNEKTGLRKITTTIQSRTFFDSKSDLAKLKASQTDKTQSLGIGSLASESAGTNVMQSLDRTISILQLLRPTP